MRHGFNLIQLIQGGVAVSHAGEPGDDHGDSGDDPGLGVPFEAGAGELDMPSVIDQRFEQCYDRLALADAVRGYEREFGAWFHAILGGFAEPAGHIVQVSVVLVGPDESHVLALFVGFLRLSDERRVAHHVIAFHAGQERVPVESKRICFENVRGVRERESRHAADDATGVVEHLLFSDPQCGSCHGAGETVDFDSVEMVDGHLDVVDGVAHVELQLAGGQRVPHIDEVFDDPVLHAS